MSSTFTSELNEYLQQILKPDGTPGKKLLEWTFDDPEMGVSLVVCGQYILIFEEL